MSPLLDPVDVLTACRRWPEAEAAARAHLDALEADPGSDRLALARAMRKLADVLVDADRAAEATSHVVGARGLYRPFEREAGPLAEISWTVARHAFATARSREAEESLATALRVTDSIAELGPWRARALRFKAHMLILRGDFEAGAAAVDEALAAVRASPGAGALVRLELLFTRGEVHLMLDEPARAREATRAAIDLCESRFRDEPMLREHAREREARLHAVLAQQSGR
jgi:hypothetical protein